MEQRTLINMDHFSRCEVEKIVGGLITAITVHFDFDTAAVRLWRASGDDCIDLAICQSMWLCARGLSRVIHLLDTRWPTLT